MLSEEGERQRQKKRGRESEGWKWEKGRRTSYFSVMKQIHIPPCAIRIKLSKGEGV